MKRAAGIIAAVLALSAASARAQQAFPTDPMLPEHAVRQVSLHVYVIMGFPNVGIVVGDKATLVVDTGLGARNGALVAREAARLSTKGQKLILTTTHFHPEHASGQGGFPAGTVVVRPRVQQVELEKDGPAMVERFSADPARKALLAGTVAGKADVLFGREHDLDLGGVHANLYWFGAAHTLGDEIVFVPEDSLILPGDVVENRISPNVICDSCSPRQWIAVLDEVAKLKPARVVPDHGDLGDGGLIARERAFLADLDTRAMALKAQGKSAGEAGRIVEAELAAKYPDWKGLGNVPASVQHAYAGPR